MYFQLAPGCSTWTLLFFLTLVPTSAVHAVESAHAACTRPTANNLPTPHFGRLRARHRTHPRARRRRKEKRLGICTGLMETTLQQEW
eukprot:7476916-Pyramimonas_sp.AAC.1